ncbi:MAG TPA: hypothetical protein VK886_06980 [Vicinamibacterales bacterium]|nr:hypothetical protein [Vicinamibacterales bacterium]
MALCSQRESRRTSALFAALLLLFAPALHAQTDGATRQSVEDVLSFLLTNQAVPTGDFAKDREAAAATSTTIARALLVNLTTQPIASSSSGFSYRFNSELGTFERASESFGPIIAERVQTTAPGQVSLGVTYRFARFDRLDGRRLEDGFVTTANRFRDEASPFDVETLTMRLSTHTLALVANAGIAPRVEVSGALPFVALRLEGERTNVYRGSTFVQASGSADVAGIGDAIARVKVHVAGNRTAGFAVGTDLRLPTGRREDLLGAGRAGYRLLAITSAEGLQVAGHANAFMARGGLSDETGFAGAVAFSPAPTLTVATELLVRRLSEIHSIQEFSAAHPTISGVDTLRLVAGTASTTMTLMSLGFKWNATETWLLNGGVTIPIGDAGLTARWIPTVVVEYTFR